MSQIIPRGGNATVTVPAGQSIVIGSFGPGSTSVKTAAVSGSALVPVFGLYSTVIAGATFITFAAATQVLIEASYGSDVEYDFGAAPALVYNPYSVATGITAFAGGGQSSATLLTAAINRVGTVATAADSVKLPPATVGKKVSAFNGGANSMNVFPQTGESIASGAANAAFAVGAAKGVLFECAVAGTWNANLGA